MSGYAIGRLPLGVAVLGLLVGILGAFVLAVGLIVALLGVGTGIAGGAAVPGLSGAIAGLVLMLLGGAMLGVAVGLWDQELWALAVAVIVLLFYGVVEFLSGSWLLLIVVGGLLLYLVSVSSHFD